MALWLDAHYREDPIAFTHFSHLALTASSDLER
jgi:hypothetical protein